VAVGCQYERPSRGGQQRTRAHTHTHTHTCAYNAQEAYGLLFDLFIKSVQPKTDQPAETQRKESQSNEAVKK